MGRPATATAHYPRRARRSHDEHLFWGPAPPRQRHGISPSFVCTQDKLPSRKATETSHHGLPLAPPRQRHGAEPQRSQRAQRTAFQGATPPPQGEPRPRRSIHPSLPLRTSEGHEGRLSRMPPQRAPAGPLPWNGERQQRSRGGQSVGRRYVRPSAPCPRQAPWA
jgi:hypothetical protein